MPNMCSGTEMSAARVLLSLSNEVPKEVPASRKRGRPLGSKNKPKVPKEVPASRKRGRPLGSKNKPKVPKEVPASRKRGRPLGSKNKPKVPKEVPASRKRGRPLGSKNKPKVPKEVPAPAGWEPIQNEPESLTGILLSEFRPEAPKKRGRPRKNPIEVRTTPKKVYKCSLCGLAGHTKKKCPTCIDLCALD